MIMNKLPNISLNLANQACGLAYKVELNLPVLLPKLQETLGVDLQSVIIPLLARFIRWQIKRLESSKELGLLAQEDELEILKLKIDEQKLNNLLTDHE